MDPVVGNQGIPEVNPPPNAGEGVEIVPADTPPAGETPKTTIFAPESQSDPTQGTPSKLKVAAAIARGGLAVAKFVLLSPFYVPLAAGYFLGAADASKGFEDFKDLMGVGASKLTKDFRETKYMFYAGVSGVPYDDIKAGFKQQQMFDQVDKRIKEDEERQEAQKRAKEAMESNDEIPIQQPPQAPPPPPEEE